VASLEDKTELLDALETKLAFKAREDFETFASLVELPGAPVSEDEDKFYPEKVKPAAHHKLIMRAIQDLADGKMDDVDGVMIFCPPGAAKSSYSSVLAPAWLLGRKPGTNVIATSYGDELAVKFGRRVRAIVRSPEFSKYMGCQITGDNQAVHEWSLTNGSDYRAAGLGGTITGLRANFLIIDDPVKNREEADSELIREKRWQAYLDDVSTRLKPGGKIFIIMTRWSEADLCGMLLGEKWKGQSGLWRCTDGRLYNVINLPLLAEHADDPMKRKPGELLWPQWFRQKDADRLQEAARKGGTQARTWSSLYQQRPAPNEGAILSRSYWQAWTKKVPECNQVFLCYDTAFEEGEENDFSSMTAWGTFDHVSKKPGGLEYEHQHVILLGAWNERVSAVDLADAVKFHNGLFKPDLILVEKRASGIQLVQELKRMRLPVKAWLPPGKPGAKGKIPRAHAVAHVLESGSVHYVPGKRTENVLDQCAAFPFGKHDDLVDTVTCALSFFRRSGMFQTPDDELDKAEIEEALLRKTEERRTKRTLYSGPIDSSRYQESDEDDMGPLRTMTSDSRRRFYGN
jgi:phage terminase large subunit-like protein